MINEAKVKKYCSEDLSKIENYEQAVNDKTQTWDCHHRLEIQGQFKNSPELLKKCGLYYNVPAWQLIFLTNSEHRRLHRLGKPMSEETRKKLSMSLRGKRHSEETKKKMSIAHKGKHLSEETRKKLSLSHRGKFSWNKGKSLSEETRKKLSLSQSGEKNSAFGTQWWNNGVKCVRSKECPGEGWVRGRLKRK